MLNGLYILDQDAFDLVYGPDERAEIASLVRIQDIAHTRATIAAQPHLLANVDVIFSGWGMPVVDDEFLDAAPNLAAIFYAAGAVGSWMTPAVAQRNVLVTSAQEANSRPVAEYTLAMIVLGLKQAFSLARQTLSNRSYPDRNVATGIYGATVGLISFGQIARILRQLLAAFDANVIVYDPFLSATDAAAAGVKRVGLEELFETADVVSLHTPLLPETVGMITGAHLSSMKFGATFINTARGPLVREEEMLDVLERRPDLQAILDVAANEPPLTRSRIFTLPNVMHTPHIAGSVGPECRRMGRHMVNELRRYLQGEPLKTPVDFGHIKHTSNRFVRLTKAVSAFPSRSPESRTEV